MISKCLNLILELEKISPEALQEAHDELARILEFYNDRTQPTEPAQPIEKQIVTAKISKAIVRPPLILDDSYEQAFYSC